MTKPLTCPFCGAHPIVGPEDPTKDGNAWGIVECVNTRCAVRPQCADGDDVADERGSDAYKEAAIRRWNQRA